jgi:cation diffusion facilitator CzcD-associated flavoprotein CzcO
VRILVVGAGAVGCYFGSALLRVEENVTFVASRAHLDAIKKNGLVVRSHEIVDAKRPLGREKNGIERTSWRHDPKGKSARHTYPASETVFCLPNRIDSRPGRGRCIEAPDDLG